MRVELHFFGGNREGEKVNRNPDRVLLSKCMQIGNHLIIITIRPGKSRCDDLEVSKRSAVDVADDNRLI